MIKVNEFFVSIQGEGTRTGRLCSFIRLSGCSFGCYYCDTKYANSYDGIEYSVDDLVKIVKNFDTKLVEITGGEPLEQEETPILAQKLLDAGFSVLIETNGIHDISVLPKEAVRIVDVKLPWAGRENNFLYDNLKHLTSRDELKFVIDSIDGYRWARRFVDMHEIPCQVIFSPMEEKISPQILAQRIIKDRLDVMLGLQLHKILWGDKRGV